MGQHYSTEEVEARYIAAMGAPLGKLYYQLFNECALLHLKWHEFMVLFGTSPAEIDLLNKAAPRFFGLLQVVLWEDVLLHIARLMDRRRDTLSLGRLPKLVAPAIQKTTIEQLESLRVKTQFALDWRHKHIGHRNLQMAVEKQTPELLASRRQVIDAIGAVDDVLNTVEEHYCHSAPIDYSYVDADATSLLRVLKTGVKYRGHP